MITAYAKLGYMHTLASKLNPGHIQDISWDYDAIEPLIPDEVQAVSDHFNATGFNELLGPLRELVRTDPTTGVDYALLATEISSKQEAIVHFNPFANGMDDNMLLRAEYLNMVFRGFGITDNNGSFLPLLTFSAPSASRTIRLKRHHHRKTARGEFDALASHYVSVIRKHGFRRLQIIGFSQGGTMAAAVAAEALRAGLQVSHLAVGEPANVMKRTRRQLGKDFNASAKHLNPAIDASGIVHLKEFYGGGSSVRYVLGLARMGRLNINLISGLSKATFTNDLHKVLKNDTVITVGWGGLNTISPPETMRRLISESRTGQNVHYHAIHTVELHGAHHTWADRLNVLATFYAYALLR
jgi:pimeloyl-ACP methyl ester carboxylesterase